MGVEWFGYHVNGADSLFFSFRFASPSPFIVTNSVLHWERLDQVFQIHLYLLILSLFLFSSFYPPPHHNPPPPTPPPPPPSPLLLFFPRRARRKDPPGIKEGKKTATRSEAAPFPFPPFPSETPRGWRKKQRATSPSLIVLYPPPPFPGLLSIPFATPKEPREYDIVSPTCPCPPSPSFFFLSYAPLNLPNCVNESGVIFHTDVSPFFLPPLLDFPPLFLSFLFLRRIRVN